MRLLRLLSSRPLPCGCFAGIYETYGGPIAWVVDARGDGCAEPRHRPGTSLRDAGHGVMPALQARLPAPRWNH